MDYLCREKQENNLKMELMEVNDSFRTNPDASTITEDFFNKALHVYGEDHFPPSDKVNKEGWREN